MPRKVVTRQPQRRKELNRAQLKALAARQAMTSSAVATARARPAEEIADEAPATIQPPYAGVLPRAQRRFALTREQEFSYIRRDLIRLTIISLLLLALLLGLLVFLR